MHEGVVLPASGLGGARRRRARGIPKMFLKPPGTALVFFCVDEFGEEIWGLGDLGGKSAILGAGGNSEETG